MADPIVKYPGGKRDQAAQIIELFPPSGEYHTYVEPFVGGAAVYLTAQARGLLGFGELVILGDRDNHLIDLYDAVRRSARRVHRVAEKERAFIADGLTERERKKCYNSLRSLWNAEDRKPGYHLVLRHACYNGVFRISKKGSMNMPPRDRLDRLRIPSIEELETFASAIGGVTLLDWDFRDYEDGPVFIGPGCVVYLDPPFHGDKVFREYTAAGFTDEDQRALLELAAVWSSRGARVIYSNTDNLQVRAWLTELWPAATVGNIEAYRSASCRGDTRGAVQEILAYA